MLCDRDRDRVRDCTKAFAFTCGKPRAKIYTRPKRPWIKTKQIKWTEKKKDSRTEREKNLGKIRSSACKRVKCMYLNSMVSMAWMWCLIQFTALDDSRDKATIQASPLLDSKSWGLSSFVRCPWWFSGGLGERWFRRLCHVATGMPQYAEILGERGLGWIVHLPSLMMRCHDVVEISTLWVIGVSGAQAFVFCGLSGTYPGYIMIIYDTHVGSYTRTYLNTNANQFRYTFTHK